MHTPSSKANGLNSRSGHHYLQKKLQLLEEPFNNNNNNNISNINTNSQEDKFEDTFANANEKQQNTEEPVIFSNENSSITRSVRDQFAVALLKLQTDLDSTDRKLSELEDKLNATTSKLSQQQQQQQRTFDNNRKSSERRRKFGTSLNDILYLSWPVLVFIALRALERRTLSAAATATLVKAT